MRGKTGKAASRLARLPALGMELLFPARCPFCDAVLGFSGFCGACAETLRAVCRMAGAPVPTQGHEMRWTDAVYAPYFYESIVQNAILRMKFHGRPDLARPLAGTMAGALREAGLSRCNAGTPPDDAGQPLREAETPPHDAGQLLREAETPPHNAGQLLREAGTLLCDVEMQRRADEQPPCTAAQPLRAEILVPVPSGRCELRRRGYDVPLNLARLLGKALHLPVREALYKTRETTPQAGLSGEERRRNLHGAFAVRGDAAVAGRRILLVDDVYTTGTTLDECAGALKAAGTALCTGICIAAVR